MCEKSSIDLFRQELRLLNEYVDRVTPVQTDFLVTHCELLLNYIRNADSEPPYELERAA